MRKFTLPKQTATVLKKSIRKSKKRTTVRSHCHATQVSCGEWVKGMVMSMNNISADDIRNFTKQGEGPHVEFKTRFTADNLIARHLSAFANSGGGIIIFGVGSHGEILGLSDEELKHTMSRLKRLAGSLLPIYAYELDAVSI